MIVKCFYEIGHGPGDVRHPTLVIFYSIARQKLKHDYSFDLLALIMSSEFGLICKLRLQEKEM